MEFIVEEEKIDTQTGARLKVFGVGGGGNNAVNSMAASSDMDMVTFLVANTDAQALQMSPVVDKIQLGDRITKGLGAGSNPDVGRRAAEEDLDAIMKHISGTDILFLTAGMGGGTGSGALPVIAQAAREMGILTVAVVTKPFTFEGRRRMRHANDAIKHIKQSVDTLLVVPNQKLLESVDPKISMLDAFALSNDVLKQAIKGISDIIVKPGHINVDFADVRSIMKDMGMALMGMGRVEGEDRARKAAEMAINSPLLEDVSIEGARGVLINITGNTDLGLHEINEAAEVVYNLVSEDANIILGSVINQDMGSEIMVTVIATGFEQGGERDAGQEFSPYRTQQKQEVYRQAPSHRYVQESHHQAGADEQMPQQPSSEQAREREMHMRQDVEPTQSPVQGAFNMQDLDTPAFLRRGPSQEKE